jgi:hypothetical protein
MKFINKLFSFKLVKNNKNRNDTDFNL